MTGLVAEPRDWHEACETPKTTFRPGVRVQHRNPELGDWLGVIEAPLDGEYAGQHLRYDTCAHHGDEPCVRIRWTAGSTDIGSCSAIAGWFGVSTVCAVEEREGAQVSPPERTTTATGGAL